MKGSVEPRLSKGLQDILPEQMIARQRMIDTIRGVFESYGFSPLATPAIEYLDVLQGTAGDEAQQSIFKVVSPEDEALGLRFDLTVPLARVFSQYQELPRPFRRYQSASVWRADKPDKGRFREFGQFDIDAVGVPDDIADVEMIAALCDALTALKVGSFRVRFSSRKILSLLLDYAGIEQDRAKDVFRVLDKLDKIGMKKVELELTTGYTDDSGDTIKGVGLESSQVDRIKSFLDIGSSSRAETIAELRDLFADLDGAAEELDIIDRISTRLDALGYLDDKVIIDVSIARGLAYYTGTVFETVLLDAPKYGSVASGGRYDHLVERFLGEPLPAIGASIGIDRLLAALVDLGRIEPTKSTATVIITAMDEALMDDYLKMAFELRRAGIPTELYQGSQRKIKKQFKYIDKLGIPIAVVCGGDEAEKGIVQIKDMGRGKALAENIGDRAEWLSDRPGQFQVPRKDLVDAVRSLMVKLDA